MKCECNSLVSACDGLCVQTAYYGWKKPKVFVSILPYSSPLDSVIYHTLSNKRPHICGEIENIGFAAGCQDLCHFPTILIRLFIFQPPLCFLTTVIIKPLNANGTITHNNWMQVGAKTLQHSQKQKNCDTGKLILHSISSLCFSGIYIKITCYQQPEL